MTRQPDDLTGHEIIVLEMLNGDREGEWGAWVSACLEFLQERGLCTRGPNYRITPKGAEALKRARAIAAAQIEADTQSPRQPDDPGVDIPPPPPRLGKALRVRVRQEGRGSPPDDPGVDPDREGTRLNQHGDPVMPWDGPREPGALAVALAVAFGGSAFVLLIWWLT